MSANTSGDPIWLSEPVRNIRSRFVPNNMMKGALGSIRYVPSYNCRHTTTIRTAQYIHFLRSV
jgi:hypothetical protein